MLTNPHTNICGCYEIGYKQAAVETGLSVDKVKKLMKRLADTHKVISYDDSTKEVLIYNWGKYNWSSSDKLVKGIEKVATFIKKSEFREYVVGTLNGDTVHRPSVYPMDTVSIPYTHPMDTSVSVSVSVSDTASVSNPVSDYTEDFEIFWNEYPKKVGKREAFTAFKKAKQPIQLLLHAVQEQKQSSQWQKEDGRYIPNPATWLNQGRWDDTLPKPKVGERDSDGYYTLSDGTKTSNYFLVSLDKERNGQTTDEADFIYPESGVPQCL